MNPKIRSWIATATLGGISLFSATSAHAVDGCKFLLCIAGPWPSIPECRSVVKEVLRDLMRGRAFPTCGMSGAGNNAGNAWTDEPTCPSMYRMYDSETGRFLGCSFVGRISVNVNGGLWSHTYWDMGGNTSTWYSDSARTTLTSTTTPLPLDDAFKTDLWNWNSTKVAQCTASGGTPAFGEYGAFERCDLPWWIGGGAGGGG